MHYYVHKLQADTGEFGLKAAKPQDNIEQSIDLLFKLKT